jgi:hypothetical protein
LRGRKWCNGEIDNNGPRPPSFILSPELPPKKYFYYYFYDILIIGNCDKKGNGVPR